MFYIFFTGNKTNYIRTVYKEKTGDSNTESQENFIGFCDINKKHFFIHFLDGFCKKRKHRIQEHRSEHHSNFDYFHRNRIERYGSIGNISRFQNRKKDDIHFEIQNIEKKCESVGERGGQNMLCICTVKTESYFHYFSRINIEHCRHYYISEKSGEHYSSEHNRICEAWIE